jgi:hypothetical protein
MTSLKLKSNFRNRMLQVLASITIALGAAHHWRQQTKPSAPGIYQHRTANTGAACYQGHSNTPKYTITTGELGAFAYPLESASVIFDATKITIIMNFIGLAR